MKKQKAKQAESEKNPYLEITSLLHIAFDHFNQKLCKGELKPIIIMVGTRGRKAAYGWFATNRWEVNGKRAELQHEINVCAETVNRGMDDVLETLIHEMAHQDNHQKGIDDCNKLGWHNKRFKSKAEEFGLVVSKMRGKGFAQTELGPRAKELIASLPFKREEWPDIVRLDRFGRKLVGGKDGEDGLGDGENGVEDPNANSFLICTKGQKNRFNALNPGMKQKDFVEELLNVYEANISKARKVLGLSEANN